MLFLVVNKAESDDIIRFCELDDVLPLLPFPVPYPPSVYLWRFRLRTFISNGQDIIEIERVSEFVHPTIISKEKREKKMEFTEFLIIQCKERTMRYSNAQHVESVLFVLFASFFSFHFFFLCNCAFPLVVVIEFSILHIFCICSCLVENPIKRLSEYYSFPIFYRVNVTKMYRKKKE